MAAAPVAAVTFALGHVGYLESERSKSERDDNLCLVLFGTRKDFKFLFHVALEMGAAGSGPHQVQQCDYS